MIVIVKLAFNINQQCFVNSFKGFAAICEENLSSTSDHKPNHAPHVAELHDVNGHITNNHSDDNDSAARNGINYLFEEFLSLACFHFFIHAVLASGPSISAFPSTQSHRDE